MNSCLCGQVGSSKQPEQALRQTEPPLWSCPCPCPVPSPRPAGGSPSGELSEEEAAALGRYVNASYLQQENWGKVAVKFGEDGSVQLQNFLRPALAAQVAQVRAGWRWSGPGWAGGAAVPSVEAWQGCQGCVASGEDHQSLPDHAC